MILEGVNDVLPRSVNDLLPWGLFERVSFGRPYIPIIGCSPFNFRMTTAWHLKPQMQYPHTLKYRCLRAILDNDINELKLVLDSSGFEIDSVIDRRYQMTALNLAVLFDRKTIVKYLILRGAGVEALDGKGESPLSVAVRNCSYGSIDILLESGADIDRNDKYGFSVIDKARIRGYESLTQYLRKKSADRKGMMEQRAREGRLFWDIPKFEVRFSWEGEDEVWEGMVKGRKFWLRRPLIYPFNDLKGTYFVNVMGQEDKG